MEISDEHLEEIGLLVDNCENLLGAAELPLPPALHIEGLTGGIKGMRDRLKTLFFDLGGDKDTWD